MPASSRSRVRLRQGGRELAPLAARYLNGAGENSVVADVVIRPCKDRVAGDLAAVVADGHLRSAALADHPIEFACDWKARQRGIGDQRQVLTRAVIDDPEAVAIREVVGDEFE